jgi:Putative peptidoglycan binding domain
MAAKRKHNDLWSMKKLKLLSLIGITSIALANAGWAAGHGGGGGGFGGGGFSGGGHGGGGGRAGPAGSGFHGGFHGGAGFRSRGPGFSGRPFNGRMGRIVERHDANWHRDWDRHHGHFFHNRFFVFDDGFWFGLDPWFYPYDYYYSYDDQDYYGYDASNDPYSVSMVGAVQSDLARQGYYRGVIDGVYGPQTRVAITRYQSKHGLRATGSLTTATLRSLGLPQPMGS